MDFVYLGLAATGGTMLGFGLCAMLSAAKISDLKDRQEMERQARHLAEQAGGRAAAGRARAEAALADLRQDAYVREGNRFVRVARND